MRGADGKLYFILDDELKTFEMSEDASKAVSETLDFGDKAVTARKRDPNAPTPKNSVLLAWMILVNTSALRQGRE